MKSFTLTGKQKAALAAVQGRVVKVAAEFDALIAERKTLFDLVADAHGETWVDNVTGFDLDKGQLVVKEESDDAPAVASTPASDAPQETARPALALVKDEVPAEVVAEDTK